MRDEFKPGQITARQAKLLNELFDVAEQFRRMTAAPPLYLTRPAGIPQLRLGLDLENLLDELQAVGDCSGWGWVAGLRRRDSLRVTIEGDAETELILSSTEGLTWGDTASEITICGYVFSVSFGKGDPNGPTLALTYLRLSDESGSGSGSGAGSGSGSGSGDDTPSGTYVGVRDCAGCSYGYFAFGRCDVCRTDPPTAGGCPAVVRVRVDVVPSFGQAFDVALSCCPGVLFPRVLTIEHRKCLTDELWPFGAPFAGATVSSMNFVWDATFTAAWWTGFGAWVSESGLVFGCNQHAGGAWWWEMVSPDGPAVIATVAVGACPDDPAAALELAMRANPGNLPGVDPAATEVCPAEPSGVEVYYRAVVWTDAGCDEARRPCAIPGWQGAGWYCIWDEALNRCRPEELLDEDECNTNVVICGVRYVDEAAATAA